MWKPNRILLVSAHPDDAETSSGGTIVRFKRENVNVTVWSVYFAPCNEDIKNEGHIEQHKQVCKKLKIDNLIQFNYKRDTLELYKQEIRNDLYEIREHFKPDLVFCPSLSDMHQDHKAVAECCLTIFRDTSSIFGYEVLRSVGSNFKPNVYVILETEDVLKKMEAIKLYKSQIKNRPYFFSEEAFHAQMIMRGVQAKTLWAESFELIRGRW